MDTTTINKAETLGMTLREAVGNKALLQQLEGNTNTVFILSDGLKENIKSVQREVPGLELRYKPLSLYHAQLLELCNDLGIGITCCNEELLEQAEKIDWKREVLIGNEYASNTFIRKAYAAGCTNFTVCNAGNIDNILDAIGEVDVQFTLQVDDAISADELGRYPVTGLLLEGELETPQDVAVRGELLQRLLEHQPAVTNVTLGSIRKFEKVERLKEALVSLQKSLPPGCTLTVNLDQDILESSLFIVTRILAKNGQSYTVDMSMYEELLCYLDEDHDISVITDSPVTGTVLGKTGDEEDVICIGAVGEHEVGEWLLLENIALVDCRELPIFTVDMDLRLRLTEYQSAAREIKERQLEASVRKRRKTLITVTV